MEHREEPPVALGRRRILAEEPPAPNAGRAAQRDHLEPGVVREGRQPCRARVGAGLEGGVLRVRIPTFIGLGGSADEVAGRNEVEVEPAEDLAVLADLSGIGRADEQARPVRPRGTHRSAARCAATSCAMPSSERASTRSKSARVNGRPSAVPCTSMSSPASVATTFTSASAIESSA